MDELVSFLKSQGAPTWAIVAIVIVAILFKPISWLIGYVHRRPTMDEMMTARLQELGRQQGAFFDRLERQATTATEEARDARAATARCEAKHEECQETVCRLGERVGELEKLSGFVRGAQP